MRFFDFDVSNDFESAERLDKYIASVCPEMNRSKLKSGATEVLLNGKKAKLSSIVRAGDRIEFAWEENIPDDIEPENIPLDIIYEDENVTVVNKAQGMVTHPACGNWSKTLVNALLFHWGRDALSLDENLKTTDSESDELNDLLNEENEQAVLNLRRPGIVHRLDKDTSGIIITAKNRESEEWLLSQFKDHDKITKEYICICSGHPKQIKGEIKTFIIRNPSNRKRFKALRVKANEKIPENAKFACTKYRCVACYGPYSLMKVIIKTGRTHQIRVHMKYIGCPVTGDTFYANTSKGTILEGATLMLHSYRLKIRLPFSAEYTVFTAPVPLRFKKAIKVLRSRFKKSLPPERC